jgi:hypothetical protein
MVFLKEYNQNNVNKDIIFKKKIMKYTKKYKYDYIINININKE